MSELGNPARDLDVEMPATTIERLRAVPDPVFVPSEEPPVEGLPSTYALLSHPSAPSAAIRQALAEEQRRAEIRERAEIGDRIRRAREKAGWSQAELAELVGTNTAIVAKLERGEAVRNRGERLERLAGALGLPSTHAPVSPGGG